MFPCILISLLLSIKLTTSASFRSISKIMVLVNLYLDLNIKEPCHVTILLWVKKMGIYKLTQTKEKADDWIIMIDESIEFWDCYASKPEIHYEIDEKQLKEEVVFIR